MTNADLTAEGLEEILLRMKDIECLDFGKDFTFEAEHLAVIQRCLKNLKKLILFADFPLSMQKIVKEIFGPCDVNFVYNPNCLEEWTEDEIEKI